MRLLIILSLLMLSQVCEGQDWLPQTNKQFKGNVKQFRYQSADGFTSYTTTNTYNRKGFIIEAVSDNSACLGVTHDSTVYTYSQDSLIQRKIVYTSYSQQPESTHIATTNYVYNNGKLTRYILNTSNGKNDTMDIRYDVVGRVNSYGYTSSPWPEMSYTYDDKGKLITEKGMRHQDVHEYDMRDKLVSTKRYEHGQLSQVIRYKYNAHGVKMQEVECSMKTKYHDYEHCATTYFDADGYEAEPLIKKKGDSNYTFERDKSGRLVRQHWETTGIVSFSKTKEYQYFD